MSIRLMRLIGQVGWQRVPLNDRPFGQIVAANANGVRATIDDGKSQRRMDRQESYNGHLSESRVGYALRRPPCKMAIGVASLREGGGHMRCPQMELHCLVVSTWNLVAQRRPCHQALENIPQCLWNQCMVAKENGGQDTPGSIARCNCPCGHIHGTEKSPKLHRPRRVKHAQY